MTQRTACEGSTQYKTAQVACACAWREAAGLWRQKNNSDPALVNCPRTPGSWRTLHDARAHDGVGSGMFVVFRLVPVFGTD
jgi:hypothetical protein